MRSRFWLTDSVYIHMNTQTVRKEDGVTTIPIKQWAILQTLTELYNEKEYVHVSRIIINYFPEKYLDRDEAIKNAGNPEKYEDEFYVDNHVDAIFENFKDLKARLYNFCNDNTFRMRTKKVHTQYKIETKFKDPWTKDGEWTPKKREKVYKNYEKEDDNKKSIASTEEFFIKHLKDNINSKKICSVDMNFHSGMSWLLPGSLHDILILMLNNGVHLRILVNTPDALNPIARHMRNDSASYLTFSQCIEEWKKKRALYPNLEIKASSIPFIHNYHSINFIRPEEHSYIYVKTYTYNNSDVNKNPAVMLDSSSDSYLLYRNEFEYLWNKGNSLYDNILTKDNNINSKEGMRPIFEGTEEEIDVFVEQILKSNITGPQKFLIMAVEEDSDNEDANTIKENFNEDTSEESLNSLRKTLKSVGITDEEIEAAINIVIEKGSIESALSYFLAKQE